MSVFLSLHEVFYNHNQSPHPDVSLAHLVRNRLFLILNFQGSNSPNSTNARERSPREKQALRHYTSEGRKWKTLFFGSCSVSVGGGAAGSWLPHSRWSRTHSLKVSDPGAGGGWRGGRGRGTDAILDLDVCAV